MAPFTALPTLELQAPLGIQTLRRATEQLSVHSPPATVKNENVRALLLGETCQPRVVILS